MNTIGWKDVEQELQSMHEDRNGTVALIEDAITINRSSINILSKMINMMDNLSKMINPNVVNQDAKKLLETLKVDMEVKDNTLCTYMRDFKDEVSEFQTCVEGLYNTKFTFVDRKKTTTVEKKINLEDNSEGIEDIKRNIDRIGDNCHNVTMDEHDDLLSNMSQCIKFGAALQLDSSKDILEKMKEIEEKTSLTFRNFETISNEYRPYGSITKTFSQIYLLGKE